MEKQSYKTHDHRFYIIFDSFGLWQEPENIHTYTYARVRAVVRGGIQHKEKNEEKIQKNEIFLTNV